MSSSPRHGILELKNNWCSRIIGVNLGLPDKNDLRYFSSEITSKNKKKPKMKILHFFLLCISVFGHKTINHWTKFHGKKIFKIIIVNIRYGGYHILVHKVFEGDLSCDCICKKLKFDTPRIKNGQSYGTIKVKPRGSWIIWHRPDRYQRISAIFNFRLNYFFLF